MMDLERFDRLAQAYGGVIERWPPAVQRQACAVAAESEQAQAILVREGRLDARLDAFDLAGPSMDLQRRVTTRLLHERRPLLRATAALAALIAAAGASTIGAGVLAGAASVALLPPPPHTGSLTSLYDQSSFGDLGVVDAGDQVTPGT